MIKACLRDTVSGIQRTKITKGRNYRGMGIQAQFYSTGEEGSCGSTANGTPALSRARNPVLIKNRSRFHNIISATGQESKLEAEAEFGSWVTC